MAGAYFSYPFTRRWSLGCKALAGYSYILDRSIGRDEIKLGNNGFAWSAGVSVGYVLKRILTQEEGGKTWTILS